MKKQPLIAASLICSNPLNLEQDLLELIKGSADYIHFDVMDGQFVPRYGLYPEILSHLTKITSIPVDVHMMVQNPEEYIEDFKNAAKTPLIIVLDDIRSLNNIGSVFRTSDAFLLFTSQSADPTPSSQASDTITMQCS